MRVSYSPLLHIKQEGQEDVHHSDFDVALKHISLPVNVTGQVLTALKELLVISTLSLHCET